MRWLVAVLVLIIVLGAAGVGYWLILSPHIAAEASAGAYRPGPVYDLGVIVTNLNDSNRPVYIQVGVQLELDGKASFSEVKQRDGAVRDAVIRVLRSKGQDDVQGDTGMSTVADQIRSTLNSLLTRGAVKAVHFTQFLVQ